MVTALKVALIVYGAIRILMGLVDITMPELVANMYGFGEMAGYAKWMGEVIGAIFIAIGFWVIVAGRDPMRHINWLNFVITVSLLGVAVTIHSVIMGYVDFSQVIVVIIYDGIFAVAFLALYPWRAARSEG